MKSRIFLPLIFGCMFFVFTKANSQSSNSEKLSNLIKNYIAFSKNYPQEKVYLHFDNTEYYQGETIWFKAYVVRADRNALADMSKILYVELISSEGNIIETKKLKIENGQCNGEFNIDSKGYGGFFEVRAYTRYMLNFGENNYFTRVFAVYDKPLEDAKFTQKISEAPRSKRIPQIRTVFSQKEKLALHFYPEGGNLVAGLASQVAFKAIGEDGENAIISGYLYNEKNEKMTEISTEFNGTGIFTFIPDSGKYQIKIPHNNKEYSFPLPKILPWGYVMSVNNFSKDKVGISIQKNQESSSDTLGLSISNRGILYGFEKIGWGTENAVELSISKKMLPSGVSQIVLFNSKGEVLCERMIFINHRSEMKIQVTQNKQIYRPFEKIGLVFDLKDKNDIPIQTNFSVSVRDASTSSTNTYENNILTDFLLSSDLKGYIENPAFYFEKDDKAHQQALDLLMLTQGWSRYTWKKMSGNEPFTISHPIEKGLYIEGSVKSLVRKKPKANVDVLMFLMGDSTSQHGKVITDSLGKFNFSLTDFYGRQKLSIQTKENDKRKDNNVILDRVFSPPFKSYSFNELQIPNNEYYKKLSANILEKKDSIDSEDALDNLMRLESNEEKIRLLNEVLVRERRKQTLEDEGMRDASIVYDVEKTMDDLIDGNKDEPYDILDFIEKINPYFSFDTGTEQRTVKGTYKGKNVIFCLDNWVLFSGLDSTDKKPMSDYEQLTTYSLSDIKSITINEEEGTSLKLATELSGSLKGNEVVIYVYTKKDKKYNTDIKGIRQTKFQGYSYVKEFYNIPYDILTIDKSDHRRTLYWNPNLKSDTNGKANITFFNNASCKIINVNAETVTQNGIIGTINK